MKVFSPNYIISIERYIYNVTQWHKCVNFLSFVLTDRVTDSTHYFRASASHCNYTVKKQRGIRFMW